MGYMRHHAIIVTGWSTEQVTNAHQIASELFEVVSPVTEVATNGYTSFFIPPDGSKEGWEESNNGNLARGRFMDWAKTSGTYLEVAEIQYGDEEGVSWIREVAYSES